MRAELMELAAAGERLSSAPVMTLALVGQVPEVLLSGRTFEVQLELRNVAEKRLEVVMSPVLVGCLLDRRSGVPVGGGGWRTAAGRVASLLPDERLSVPGIVEARRSIHGPSRPLLSAGTYDLVFRERVSVVGVPGSHNETYLVELVSGTVPLRVVTRRP